MSFSDEHIAAAALASIRVGGRAEQDDAVRALLPILRRMTYSVAGNHSTHRDIDDLHQMVAITVYEAAASYIPTMPALPYVATVVRRRVFGEIKHWHTSKRATPLFRDLSRHPDEHHDDDFEDCLADDREPDATERTATDEDARRTAAAIRECLSNVERVTWTMIVIRGNSYAETAAAIGRSEKTVNNALQRARNKLAKWAEREQRRRGKA